MAITRIKKQGYCIGVKMAIERVKNLRKGYPKEPIYVLGFLVHNKRVVEELEAIKVITLDDSKKTRMELLDSIKKGIVVFTAHGTDEAVKRKAIKKGLKVYDTTCHYIQDIEKKIKRALREDYKVIYVGKRHHPETIAALSIDDEIILIESHFDTLALPKGQKYYAVNQTTLSSIELAEIYDELARTYDVVIDDKTCIETTQRQEAVIDLIGQQYLIVVGDKKSHNSSMLVKVAKDRVERADLVEGIDDLDEEALWKYKGRTALTSGASTPPYVVDEIEAEIKRIYSLKSTH